MRLLVVTERLQHPPTNGAEAFAAELLRVLVREHTLTVVCRAPSEGAEPVACGARVEVPEELLSQGEALTAFLREQVDAGAHDLLYNLGNLYFGARLSAFLLILAPRLPMVNHFQAVLAQYAKVEGQPDARLEQAVGAQALCARLGALNIFSSQADYRFALVHGLPIAAQPASIVPNGVDVAALSTVVPDVAPLEAAGLDLGPLPDGTAPRLVMTSGRFEDLVKGGDIAYRAFTQLHAAAPQVRLAAVTGSERFARLLHGLPEGVAARIPWLPRDRYLALLAAADVFCLPSRYEAFGLAAAEAMALGKPVVAAAAGGAQELVQHARTGLLAEPGSGSYGLARALIQWANQPEQAAAWGAAAAAFAQRELDIARVAQLVERDLVRGLQYATATANAAAAGIELT